MVDEDDDNERKKFPNKRCTRKRQCKFRSDYFDALFTVKLVDCWCFYCFFPLLFGLFLVYFFPSITDLWRSYSFSFAFVVIYSMSILIWKITFIIFFVFPCNNSVFIYLRIFFIYFLRLNILFSRLFTLDNSTIISIIHNTNTIFYCLFQYELYLFQYERK